MIAFIINFILLFDFQDNILPRFDEHQKRSLLFQPGVLLLLEMLDQLQRLGKFWITQHQLQQLVRIVLDFSE